MAKSDNGDKVGMTTTDPTQLLLGSPDWGAAVYASGAAREVEGRSRSTVRHYNAQVAAANCDEQLGTDVSEGSYENSATLLLTLLIALGIVRRWKAQPFALLEARHGVSAFPDFMCDLEDERRFVIEVKTNRFLDEDELSRLGKVSTALQGAGLGYLLWTDKWPLTNTVKSNLVMMRRAHRIYGDGTCEKVRSALQNGQLTLRELRQKHGLSSDQVRAAAFAGHAFLNIFQQTTSESVVCCHPDPRVVATLFEATFRAFIQWRQDAQPV